MRPKSQRRAVLTGACASLAVSGLISQRQSMALMAGDPPDKPSKRIDPNSINSPWAGVGAVVRDHSGVFTGSLVHPRFVLTAAHVASGARSRDLAFQVNAGRYTKRYRVKNVMTHPQYRGQTKPFAFFDVSLLELAEPVDPAIPHYKMLDDAVKHGTVLTFIGYGGSGFGTAGPSVKAKTSVKRIGRNQLDYFVEIPPPGNLNKQAGIFLYDFDGISSDSNLMGEGSLGNLIETSAVTGDSGAPAFVTHGSESALVGVLTFVADLNDRNAGLSRFGSAGGGILLSAVAPWIRSKLSK